MEEIECCRGISALAVVPPLTITTIESSADLVKTSLVEFLHIINFYSKWILAVLQHKIIRKSSGKIFMYEKSMKSTKHSSLEVSTLWYALIKLLMNTAI